MASVAPAPAWARAVLPHAGQVRVLGERDGAPHVVGASPDVRTGTGVVLKRFADDAGRRAVRTMREVSRALAHDGATALAVPAVVAWHPQHRVVVQAEAPGRSGVDVLASPRRAPALRRVARALACLHRSSATLGPAVSIRGHIDDLIRPHPLAVAEAMPEQAARIAAIAEALLRWDAAGPPAHVAPVHRDVHLRQMTFAGSRVWLLDWDLAAMADPALDAANFAVYLRTHLDGRADLAAETFLDAYAEHAPDVRRRLGPFTALTYLRLACKAWRLARPGWHTRVDDCLTAAERAL